MLTDLQQALQAHKCDKLEEAGKYYRKVLQSNQPPVIAYMNYAAILRKTSKPSEAIKFLHRGLAQYPDNAGLWNNLGNCLLDLDKQLDALSAYRRALTINERDIEPRISIVSCLNRLGLSHLAYALILQGYKSASTAVEQNRYLLALTETIFKLDSAIIQPEGIERIIAAIEQGLRSGPEKDDPAKVSMMLCQLWIQYKDLDNALLQRDQVLRDIDSMLKSKPGCKIKDTFLKSWHAMNWNMGILLLKKGRLDPGWRLYEHGLQVPAEGPQKWQRSLKKPFRPSEVPFWRGENLKSKRVLLLGEQGIGDTMMFATLIPSLVKEGAEVFLLPGDRLIDTYRRSLPEITTLSSENILSGEFDEGCFDYQSPIGSICQHRFMTLDSYCPSFNVLTSQTGKTLELRRKYSKGRRRPLVGFSWQGGGKPNRIPMKSLSLEILKPIFKTIDADFISLQYGDDGPHIDKFNRRASCSLIHDEDIHPINDLDGWLSQVDAMDVIISIANTTIHGAGGLGKPTLCLVSNQSDWRWIDPKIYKGCYWYQSVHATYQSPDGSWESAIKDAQIWLRKTLAKLEL